MKKIFYFLTIITVCAAQAKAQWKTDAPFEGEARDGMFSFTINNDVYVGGGIVSNQFWMYTFNRSPWKQLDSIADGKNRCFSAAFATNGKGYIVGGDFEFGQATDELLCYDPVALTWQKKSPFPGGARVGMITFELGTRVFAGGGANSFDGAGYGTVNNDFYEYHPATNNWTALANMPVPMAFASKFEIDGKGYLTLGATSNTQSTANLYCFDTATMSWGQKASCPGNARNAGVGFALNGKGYAGLGQVDLQTTLQDFYEYTPTTDSWATMPNFPDDRSGWSMAFIFLNTVYVGTGANLPNLDFSKSIYTFKPTNATGIGRVWGNAAHSVYPNPFSTEINLAGFNGQTVALTNIAGQTVATCTPTDSSPINTANLPAGIYILHTPIETIKLIKQ